MRTAAFRRLAAPLIALLAAVPASGVSQVATSGPTRFALQPCHVGGVSARCGTYWVFENREARIGRKIPLKVIVLPSRSPTPEADPMWYVSPGGPGTTNTPAADRLARSSWWRDNRDVVVVDLRGTGGDHPLDCALWGAEDKPERYLMPLFPAAAVRACRDTLSQGADLTLYTSMSAVDDLDEIREALGYKKVNLWGASWGTRAVFMYLRRHPASVRSAIVEGVAPVSLKNPLTHARSAQDAFNLIAEACAAQPSCHAAFPDVQADLKTVLDRLHQAPARVTVAGGSGAVAFTWQQFVEALRVMTYYIPTERRVPLLLHAAARGDLSQFAESAIASNRGLRGGLRFGFLLSITCNEDVPRITEREIVQETAGTYLGDSRVREQIAACAEWPHVTPAADYGDPVRSNVPVFLLSGTLDPVSPPRFAADAVRYLPNGIDVVAPGAHVPAGPCVVQMERAFLNAASAKAVDRSCVSAMTLPPFATGG